MCINKVLVVVLLINFIDLNSANKLNDIVSKTGVWSNFDQIVRFVFNRCIVEENDINTLSMVSECLKRKGLRALDRVLRRDIIEISDNVALVKRYNQTNDMVSKYRTSRDAGNLKQPVKWVDILHQTMDFFRNRILRVSFKGFNSSAVLNEARHKHKSNGLGQMLLFGLVAAGLIVIPLGFQFLAVLGGKALLLAKLALLLTSIQGLKKIATSNVNYGLYSTGHGVSPAWHYDRQWPYEGTSGFHSGQSSYGGDPYTYSSYSAGLNNASPRESDY